MQKVELNLANTFTVTSRGMEVEIDIFEMPTEILAQAALHGLKQKIADAASGAARATAPDELEGEAYKAWIKDEENKPAIDATALELMKAAADRLAAGDWGAERGGGNGLGAVEKRMVGLARAQLKGRIEGYSDLTPAKRDAAVWAILSDQDEKAVAKVRKMAEAEIKREKEMQAGLGDLF